MRGRHPILQGTLAALALLVLVLGCSQRGAAQPGQSASRPTRSEPSPQSPDDFQKTRAQKVQRAKGLPKESGRPREFPNSKWMEIMRLQAKESASLANLPRVGVPALISQASSILAIVEVAPRPTGKGPFKFSPNSFAVTYRANAFPLCNTPNGWNEYHDEPAGIQCTGFVINRTHLVTAAHCLSDDSQATAEKRLSRLLFIRNYWVSTANVQPTEIPLSQIYISRTQSLDHRYVYDPQTHTDWAVIDLDRAVPEGPDLVPSKEPEFGSDELYHSFGFPFGTPMKFAYYGMPAPAGLTDGIANVRLSVFGGNSGAPVINSATGHVAGILIAVRDDPQNVSKSDDPSVCYEPTRCKPDQNCNGEMVLPISDIPEGLLNGS
jgi:Trypsin-like peptidase domain